VTTVVPPVRAQGGPVTPMRRGGGPKPSVWLLLLASAAGVLLAGIFGTALILGPLGGSIASLPAGFWGRLFVAAILTVVSLMLRSLRWIFLLRRAQTRIPIRDAYIGYFSGLSLLLAPFLLGEIAVRAFVQRQRAQVPVATTVIVNLWERFLDLSALGLLTGLLALTLGRQHLWSVGLVLIGLVSVVAPLRRACLALAVWASRPATTLFDDGRPPEPQRLAEGKAWFAALAASVAAWLLPGLGFWWVASTWSDQLDVASAQFAYAASSASGGLVLAPGGVLVTGPALASELELFGFADLPAALAAFAIRLATVGVATMLGAVFVLVHLRTPRMSESGEHFDEIADAYDVQIPESRRQALLVKKTDLMRDAIAHHHPTAHRGLDAGCGQGWYVRRMRELGFAVDGIDTSAGQITLASRHVGGGARVAIGSVLNIPEPAASCDFIYTINVLHHLGSLEEQRRAFAELLRVLRPGGLLFVHEINTRNILFRFYMGYVFPSLNCIDEGVERWLLPNRMPMYTDAPLVDLRYFTFFPDFLPQPVVRLLSPIEHLLESSPLKVFSAHYMAVLRKV
jgi:SAM-dependent methyltransferase/uncharacterized membrane protein YbhN (UPF0104 family)